ncbi:MAG: acylphosphatase [Nitrospinota bacterium]|nr:acylphosphatase [Nitrospinota bacterium]
MGEKARVHLIVHGIVQGVFFRSTTAETGLSLGLTGWAKNLPDGTVEIVAEGEKSKLEKLVAWCKKGPPSARVTSVDARWEEPGNGFETFSVRL